jgi:hypothetical protein
MQSSSVPGKFSIPFANSAGSGFVRAIPTASQIGITAGAASLTDGFPPDCFTAVAAGGVPPFGQDFNGILKQVTQWSQWQQAGGPIVCDSSFQSAIGGYPQGAVIQLGAGGPAFMSMVDNNTVTPAVGAAGWMPIPTFGGNVATVNATQTLTSTNAGLVLVNATSGNIAITLPAVASANGVPLPFYFARTDSSGNSVTLVAAGSDTFFPGGTGSTSLLAGTTLPIYGNGVSQWVSTGISAAQLNNRKQIFTSSGSFVVPAGVTTMYLSGCAAGAGAGAGGPGSIGATGAWAGGGGGGGAGQPLQRAAYPVTPGNTITVTIGAAGTGGVASGSNPGNSGTSGGNTVISGAGFNGGSSVTLSGGTAGGGGSAATTSNAVGGSAGAGFPAGGYGNDTTSGNASGSGGSGASGPFGGGGGAARSATTGGVVGGNAAGYGAGGGGGSGVYTAGGGNGGAGGNGSPGYMAFEW